MTDHREVMQMALEALEMAQMNGEAGLRKYETVQIAEVAEALRARLAEPETCKRALQVEGAEPVAWRVMLDDNVQFVYDERMLPLIDESIHATRQPLYTAPPARPLTPVQEAAPELLEALQYVIAQVPEFATVPGIRDAIAKATGACHD